MSTDVVAIAAQGFHNQIVRFLGDEAPPRAIATTKAACSNLAVILLTTSIAFAALGAFITATVLSVSALTLYALANRSMSWKNCSVEENVLKGASFIASTFVGKDGKIPPYPAYSIGSYVLWHTILSDSEWTEVCNAFSSFIGRKE